MVTTLIKRLHSSMAALPYIIMASRQGVNAEAIELYMIIFDALCMSLILRMFCIDINDTSFLC